MFYLYIVHTIFCRPYTLSLTLCTSAPHEAHNTYCCAALTFSVRLEYARKLGLARRRYANTIALYSLLYSHNRKAYTIARSASHFFYSFTLVRCSALLISMLLIYNKNKHTESSTRLTKQCFNNNCMEMPFHFRIYVNNYNILVYFYKSK